jgi:hypothetical protein
MNEILASSSLLYSYYFLFNLDYLTYASYKL